MNGTSNESPESTPATTTNSPHRGIDLGVPAPSKVIATPPPPLSVHRHDVLGGRIHEYYSAAAWSEGCHRNGGTPPVSGSTDERPPSGHDGSSRYDGLATRSWSRAPSASTAPTPRRSSSYRPARMAAATVASSETPRDTK